LRPSPTKAQPASAWSTATKFPTVFNKQSTCVTGPTGEIHLPGASSLLDDEGELGFVVGRRCRHVARPLARNHTLPLSFQPRRNPENRHGTSA